MLGLVGKYINWLDHVSKNNGAGNDSTIGQSPGASGMQRASPMAGQQLPTP